LNLLGVLPGVEVVEEEEDVVSVVPALDMDRLEALIPVEEEAIVVLACRSLRSMVPHETRSIELLSRTWVLEYHGRTWKTSWDRQVRSLTLMLINENETWVSSTSQLFKTWRMLSRNWMEQTCMEEGSDSRKTILGRGADQGAEVDQDHDPERARDPTVEVGADPGLALVMPSALDQGLDLDPGVQRPRELTEIKAGADLDPGLLPKQRSHDQDHGTDRGHETDHNPGLGVQIASLIDQDLERDQGLDHQ
jgi:hypothetical protein